MITFKKLNLMFVQNTARVLYEVSSDVLLAQERLENMLSAIDANNAEYGKGEISKQMFEENDLRLKKESARLIKNINNSVGRNTKLLEKVIKELESQKIKLPKPRKQKPRIKEKVGLKKRHKRG